VRRSKQAVYALAISGLAAAIDELTPATTPAPEAASRAV
jgi:hypothetical protein